MDDSKTVNHDGSDKNSSELAKAQRLFSELNERVVSLSKVASDLDLEMVNHLQKTVDKLALLLPVIAPGWDDSSMLADHKKSLADDGQADGPSVAKHVLLVEDNPVTQELMTRLLERRGYMVKVVSHGNAAMDVLKVERFDLALLDLGLPNMDGWQTAQAIRKLEKLTGSSRLPLVAVTALNDVADKIKAREAGIDGYHSKPIQADELFAEMERVMKTVAKSTGVSKTAKEQSLVDIKQVLSSVDDDWELFCEIVELYLADAPVQLAAIKVYIEEGKALDVREMAHTLKGGSGVFGKNPIYEAAYELEEMGRLNNLDQAMVVWNRLSALFYDMQVELLAATNNSDKKG